MGNNIYYNHNPVDRKDSSWQQNESLCYGTAQYLYTGPPVTFDLEAYRAVCFSEAGAYGATSYFGPAEVQGQALSQSIPVWDLWLFTASYIYGTYCNYSDNFPDKNWVWHHLTAV